MKKCGFCTRYVSDTVEGRHWCLLHEVRKEDCQDFKPLKGVYEQTKEKTTQKK